MSAASIIIPRSWEGFSCIEEIATVEAIPEYVALQQAIENGLWRKYGKGHALTIELSTQGEINALSNEAKYQNEYWNTDAYGIKEGGSSDPVRGRAARVVLERVSALHQIEQAGE